MQDPGYGLPRTRLTGRWVNRSLHYLSDLENASKASRALEVFARLGPCSPHAKHRTSQQPSSVVWSRSGVCGGQGFVLENLGRPACASHSLVGEGG